MKVKSQKDLFLLTLSDLRKGTEKATRIFEEITQVAQHPDIEEAVEAQAFISLKAIETIDQCFRLLGEEPIAVSGRLVDVFAEGFQNGLREIQSSAARHLFLLANASLLTQLQIAQCMSLIAASKTFRHYGVTVLLESCLADKLAFVERTKMLIREIAEFKGTEGLSASAAA